MKMRKKVAWISCISAMIVMLLSGCGSAPADNAKKDTSLNIADVAQEESDQAGEAELVSLGKFQALTLEGDSADESIFQGKTLTVLNVWATFCKPCIVEMPILAALDQEYQEKGVQVVGIVNDTIARDGSLDPAQIDLAKGIVEKSGVKYLNLTLSEDLIHLGFANLPGVPATFFFDGNGNMVGEGFLGSLDEAHWRQAFEERLEMAKQQMEQTAV